MALTITRYEIFFRNRCPSLRKGVNINIASQVIRKFDFHVYWWCNLFSFVFHFISEEIRTSMFHPVSFNYWLVLLTPMLPLSLLLTSSEVIWHLWASSYKLGYIHLSFVVIVVLGCACTTIHAFQLFLFHGDKSDNR